MRGIKTTGVSVAETPFQTSPLPSRSNLLKASCSAQRVNSIRNERDRTLRTSRWIVTRNSAIKCYPIVSSHRTSHRVWRERPLGEEVNVVSFDHLGEIDGHSIKKLARLRVSVHLFVTQSGDGCGAVQKLREKQNKQHQHDHSDQEFGQRKRSYVTRSGAVRS